MEMFLWVYNIMNRRFENGSVFVYMVNMVTFNEEFDMMQENLELS
jgi:hypothetical protein